VLYLKADAQTRERFAEVGGRPFVYEGKGKTVTVGYWTPPDEAMDSAEAMRPWAKLALEAAMRAAPAKAVGAKRARKKTTKRVSTKRTTKASASKQVAAKKAVRGSADTEESASTRRAAKKAAPKKAAKKPPRGSAAPIRKR
jgi:DNA transformation protein